MRPWLKTTATIVTILGLSACALIQREERAAPARVAEAEPEAGYQEIALVVEGLPIDALFASPARLSEAVLGLADTDNPEQIRAWIDVIESQDGDAADVPSNLTGIAALPSVQLLHAYLASLEGVDFNIRVRGRIDDYIYDAAKQAGHLAVNVKYEIFSTAASYTSGIPDHVKEYHWDVEVTDGTYEVVPHSGDPNNPFPNTLANLPLDRIAGDPTAVPPLPPLVNKLWAKGKGIVVRHVYEVFSPTSIVRLPDKHPYYVSTDESCIDMMWAGPVPAIKTEPFGPPAYCLGRCAHPEIVNTD